MFYILLLVVHSYYYTVFVACVIIDVIGNGRCFLSSD